jgi:DNA polymerase-3 subunit epsilon
VELGGAAAVNLSGSVTDVVTLPGGEGDRRMSRIRTLGLPVHDEEWLNSPGDAPPPPENGSAATRPPAMLVLPRGGVIDLPVTVDATRWTITAFWAQQTTREVDVVAFAVDTDGQVSCDEDFVFYGAPESPNGAVQLATDGPTEQAITVDLAALPRDLPRVVIAAAIDGAVTFGDIGAVETTAGPGVGESLLAQATLDAATTERTLLLGEVYRLFPFFTPEELIQMRQVEATSSAGGTLIVIPRGDRWPRRRPVRLLRPRPLGTLSGHPLGGWAPIVGRRRPRRACLGRR